VAFSGGPDSLALLHALHESRRCPLAAAHLNHQLRGDESDQDEAFARAFCADRGILLHVERLDVREAAAVQGANLESAARQVRYEWLDRIARLSGSRWVATGHTANDQAETILHHLFRGSGLRGLRGIAPCRALTPAVFLIRPLLTVTREDVLAYLQTHQLTARQDSTNLDMTLTRNRIRHELLPMLKATFQPEIIAVLGRLGRQAGEIYSLVENEAKRLLAGAEKPRAGNLIVLDVKLLSAQPRPLVREALHALWEREQWPIGAMNFDSWERLADIIDGRESAADLPDRIQVRRVGNVLQLSRRS
jgi:tRNA(Ile)-lysidine synthase